MLSSFAGKGKALPSEGKALVEGSEIVRDSVQTVRHVLRNPAKFPAVASGGRSQQPRVYAAIASYLRLVNYEFEEKTFEQYIAAIQEAAAFEMGELWHLKPFAELVLLDRLAERAEQMDGTTLFGETREPVSGESESDSGVARVSTLIASLQRIAGADWKELFERVNPIERILGEDPCSIFYSRMAFESRDAYRSTIAELARRSRATEEEIALKALELSRQLHVEVDERVRERKSHIGYYLVGNGRKKLESEIGYKRTWTERTRSFIKRCPDF